MWTPSPEQIITREQREAEALDAAWAALRTERDGRLIETDWLVLRHAEETNPTLTPEQYDELLLYRQTLRDLPENTEDPTNPEWPNEPDI